MGELEVRVEEASAANLPSLLALFEACASTCFCQYWHFTGTKNEWLDRCAHRPEENARELSDSIGTARRGLVAIGKDAAVLGWMKLLPRQEVPKLRSLPVYKSLDLGDEVSTFSVGCMLVHPDVRGQGIARALIAAAPDFVALWGGKLVEGYPRRSDVPLYPEEAWQGPERAFKAAGYTAFHDVSPYPIYRRYVR